MQRGGQIHLFYIGSNGGRRSFSGYLVLLQLEIIRFRGLVFRVHDGVYGEYVEGLDKLEEFLMAVQADVEIGELAHQQAAQEAGVDPAVFVGVFFRQFDDDPADLADVRLRFLFGGTPAGPFFRYRGGGGGFVAVRFSVEHIQVYELVAS